jgi:hypothetical protein
MGHDITPLCKHNLNTKDIGTLAKELSERFNWNIKYLRNNYHQIEDIDEFYNEDFIKEIINQSNEFYTLHDDEYFEKIDYYKKHQKNAINYQDFIKLATESTLTDSELKQKNKQVIYNSYDLQNPNFGSDSWIFQIYDFIAAIEHPYFARWASIYDLFQKQSNRQYYDEEYVPWSLDNFIDFRKEIKYYTEKLGGDKVYYLDDQSDILEGFGQGSEAEITWAELEDFVKRKCGNLLIDIPKFNCDGEYRNFCYSEIDKYKEKHNGYAISAFVDDFKDFKSKI